MFLLSPRLAFQEKWCHTVNTHGIRGKNIPMDLHMEYLNCECKSALYALGSNLTDKSVHWVGKCVGKVINILHHFDQANSIPQQLGYRPHRSSSADISKIAELLTVTHVSTPEEGRCHCTFPNFKSNLMSTFSVPSLQHWMQERLQKLIKYH